MVEEHVKMLFLLKWMRAYIRLNSSFNEYNWQMKGKKHKRRSLTHVVKLAAISSFTSNTVALHSRFKCTLEAGVLYNISMCA